MLKTIIFAKFLGPEYVSVRASKYDDYINNVDNIVLEKSTGNIVCAVDETRPDTLEELKKKQKAVMDKNIKGGAELKYGIGTEGQKLKLGKIEKAPIFYLALHKDILRKGLEGLTPSLDQVSDSDKELFGRFIIILEEQIKDLKPKSLDRNLRDRLNSFEKTLENWKKFK